MEAKGTMKATIKETGRHLICKTKISSQQLRSYDVIKNVTSQENELNQMIDNFKTWKQGNGEAVLEYINEVALSIEHLLQTSRLLKIPI